MRRCFSDTGKDSYQNIASATPAKLRITACFSDTGKRSVSGHRFSDAVSGTVENGFSHCFASTATAYAIPSCFWICSSGTPLVSGTMVFTQIN